MRIPLLARANAGTLAVLVALTAVACLLVAGLPRATQASFDQALRRSLSTAPAVQTDLTVASEPRTPDQDLHERAQFASSTVNGGRSSRRRFGRWSRPPVT